MILHVFPLLQFFILFWWFSVFILGIYMGNIPQTSHIFLLKKPSYQAKVSYLCSEKLSASPPDPPNRGSASGPRWGTAPRPPSSDVNQSIGVYTISGYPQFLAVCKCAESFSLGGFLPPDPHNYAPEPHALGTSEVPIPQLP